MQPAFQLPWFQDQDLPLWPGLSQVRTQMMDQVRHGLSQPRKWLPPWLFYDATGSALFEAITRLPEYYVSRTERGILQQNAAHIVDALGQDMTLMELGAGTATRTQVLLEAIVQRQGSCTYYPVDVSRRALDEAQARLAAQVPNVDIHPLHAFNHHALEHVQQVPGPKAVLFLGSSLGNDDPADALAFLTAVRLVLTDGDALLLGMDHVKDPAILVPAYDDAQGVTARFNRNILTRLNRELHADFMGERFDHVALWNAPRKRMEMHLQSRGAQQVTVLDLGETFFFHDSERIHTENSYKYTRRMVASLLESAGFILEQQWEDPRSWYGVYLARVAQRVD